MCGIIGSVGKENVLPLVIDGLFRLEYRGYDSSGVATVSHNGIETLKAVGRVERLAAMAEGVTSVAVIGHTRWATHGEPTVENCHPHLSSNKSIAVVHNGIIENFSELKSFLLERGFEFYSDTDTEVIAKLIEYYYSGDAARAIIKATRRLSGSFALGVVVKGESRIYAVRRESPLIIGLGSERSFIASDMPALSPLTDRFMLPDNDELAVLDKDGATVYNSNLERVDKEIKQIKFEGNASGKDGHSHYMLKEIYQQPAAAKATVSEYLKEGEIRLPLPKAGRLSVVACGSAYHAGLMGKYFIEKTARLPVDVELASEFRYKSPLLPADGITLAISQSGETADTLAAALEAKRLGQRVYSIVNVPQSSLSRATTPIYTKAGVETAVATTKGFLTQTVVAYMIALSLKPCRSLINELSSLDKLITEAMKQEQEIKRLANRLHTSSAVFFIGRGEDYAAAMEGALKLKEISYIHAQAYAAGELKHGSISLITRGMPVVALANDPATLQKTLSNVIEVRSRGGVVIALSSLSDPKLMEVADFYLPVPRSPFSSLLSVVELQLLAYYTALAKGCDIDKPRNLAKSVTVE